MEETVYRICISLCIFVGGIYDSEAACQFPENLQGTWVSSEKGPLVFSENVIVKYPIQASITVSHMDFVCQENNGSVYMLKSKTTFRAFDTNFYAHLCLNLTSISDVKFIYQHATDVEVSNGERMKASHENDDATLMDTCVREEPFNLSTFSLLVKEDAVGLGRVITECPELLYGNFSSVDVTSATGNINCSGNSADICCRTRISYTHNYCDRSLTFPILGSYSCLFDVMDPVTGVIYVHVWNNDDVYVNSTSKIVCYALRRNGNVVHLTAHPGICTAEQNETYVPKPGVVLTLDGYEDCFANESDACQVPCGHCADGSTCHRYNGTCLNGQCDQGWTGHNCLIGCLPGTFGAGCTGTCRCLQQTACDRKTGVCSLGMCSDGWIGSNCQTPCSDGTYGPNCTKHCGNCVAAPCNKISGICSDGCTPGYMGQTCVQECAAGQYGRDCKSECGNCARNQPCDKRDGRCPDAECKAGWEGPECKTKVDVPDEKNNSTVGIAIGVVFGFLLVVAIIVVVIFLRRYQLSATKRYGHEDVTSPSESNLEAHEFTTISGEEKETNGVVNGGFSNLTSTD